MVTKIHQDALLSEIATVRKLVERSGKRDLLGKISLQERLRYLEEELNTRKAGPRDLATVALVFDGGPVRGSSAIDAEFAAQALTYYQELLSKQVASTEGGRLAQRGPLPTEQHRMARMNITGLVHGSFGFILEEDSDGQATFFESHMRKAVEEISDLFINLVGDSPTSFNENLQDIDPRVFNTLKGFVKTLHRAKSTLRISEESRDLKLDLAKIALANDRVSHSDVAEIDEEVAGTLLGIVPIQRRFDFRRSDNGEIIGGKVAENLSADYLKRIEREGLVGGHNWVATVRTKSIQRVGLAPSKVVTLVDLVEIG